MGNSQSGQSAQNGLSYISEGLRFLWQKRVIRNLDMYASVASLWGYAPSFVFNMNSITAITENYKRHEVK